MGFIKEFKQFAMQGNLVDISVAFVMGAAFGKVITALTEGMVAPLIGLIGGKDLGKAQMVIQQGVTEVKDVSGVVTTAGVQEVAIKWGAFLTACIDFILVAFVMFLIIKAINRMKKKQVPAPVGPSSTDMLLMEIRDSLKK